MRAGVLAGRRKLSSSNLNRSAPMPANSRWMSSTVEGLTKPVRNTIRQLPALDALQERTWAYQEMRAPWTFSRSPTRTRCRARAHLKGLSSTPPSRASRRHCSSRAVSWDAYSWIPSTQSTTCRCRLRLLRHCFQVEKARRRIAMMSLAKAWFLGAVVASVSHQDQPRTKARDSRH